MNDWNPLLRNRRVQFALFCLLVALAAIVFQGIHFGIDFEGGTLFQIHLAEPVKDEQVKDQIRKTIQFRLDSLGLRGATVQSVGDELLFAQMSVTDPNQVEQLESKLLRQGKFESILDGNVVFTGSDLIQVSIDPAQGYGFNKVGEFYQWQLPFTLTEQGAQSFTRAAFHQCSVSGFDPTTQQKQFDCKKTYFFIDRPANAILLFDASTQSKDAELLLAGNRLLDIPQQTNFDELLLNANIPHFILDQNGFSETQRKSIQSLVASHSNAIVSSTIPKTVLNDLNAMGYQVKIVPVRENEPWVWFASGAKQVISLSEDVTNVEPYIATVDDPGLKTYSALVIRGGASDSTEAKDRLQTLTILLQSGSLPVAVDSISKETISPALGKQFLFYAGLIGLVTAAMVAGVLFVRYRYWQLIVPILFTVLSEVAMILGFSAIMGIPLDLAAITGIIAAVGTGVDDQIVITDELTKGIAEDAASGTGSIKKAFFIVFASAAVAIAAMLPIIFFGQGSGMARLIGFAITTILGVLIGVIITRPAFGEIAKVMVSSVKKK